MGRPLPKRFFGNENTGSASTLADDGIGGQGVASITNPVAGSININNSYKTFPSLVVADPTIPTGVKATTAVTWEVDTVSIAGGATYTAGTITSITGLDGFANTPTRFSVTVDGGGAPTFGAFTNRGEYTSIDGTGIATWAVVGPAGDGAAQATIKFRVKSIAIAESGSGYTAVPSLSWTTLNGTTPSGNTPTLTVADGKPYDANAFVTIICTAQTTIGGSPLTGDIVSQKGSRRYKVKTTDGTSVCNLVAATPAAVGEMTIIATDYSGNTYYVTKLTRHRVLLTQNTGSTYEFLTGSSAAWTTSTLVAGDTGITVQVASN